LHLLLIFVAEGHIFVRNESDFSGIEIGDVHAFKDILRLFEIARIALDFDFAIAISDVGDVNIAQDQVVFDVLTEFLIAFEIKNAFHLEVVHDTAHLAAFAGDDGTDVDQSAVHVVGHRIDNQETAARAKELITAHDISDRIAAFSFFDGAFNNITRSGLTIFFNGAS